MQFSAAPETCCSLAFAGRFAQVNSYITLGAVPLGHDYPTRFTLIADMGSILHPAYRKDM
jgi:hypothetical protein